MLTDMALHTDFWVVMGTASPVFFLSALVATGDASSMKTFKSNPRERVSRKQANRLLAMSYVAFAVQFVMFLASLYSLAFGHDAMPPVAGFWFAAIGVTSLLCAAAYQRGITESIEEWKEQEKAVKEESGS